MGLGMNDAAKAALNFTAQEVEKQLGANLIALCGEIMPGVEHKVRDASESFPADERLPKLAFMVETPGGIVETVERIVNTARCYWNDIVFLVPDYAMSAGTVLVMSGDSIMMDNFAVLGPIDPQVSRGGSLVPALSYLTQVQRIQDRFKAGEGTTADLALLEKIDLAELHKFEEAKELTVSLLKEWLAAYKFKDWTQTETRKLPVDDTMRKERAESIAKSLANHEHWHSHGRGIPMRVLRSELNLKIDDFGQDPGLQGAIRNFHGMLTDFHQISGLANLVYSRHYL